MSTSFKSLEIHLKNWSLYLFMGIVFLITGIWGLNEHINTLTVFIIFLSVAILVSGCLKIVFSIVDKNKVDNWIGSLVNGIIVLILGTLLIFLNLSKANLALIVGLLILRYAYNSIVHSIEIKSRKYNNWWWFATFSILGSLFALLLITYPWYTKLTRVFYASLAFILLGLFDILYAFLLKNRKQIKSTRE